MADFLANQLRQRQFMEAQRRAGIMQQIRQQQLAEQESRFQRQQALQQQEMQQRAGIAAGNMATQNRRLDYMEEEGRRRDRERARNQERIELELRRGKLSPDHRWRADDPMKQEMIPDSPTWAKKRSEHAGDVNKLQSINNSTQEFVKTIDYILDPKNKSGFNSNFGGWNSYLMRLVPNIVPGFAHTSDVGTAIDRLTELAETSGLSSVRGGSGQSVGAITEKEWPKFAAQLLKLSPRLDENTAREFLANARASALGIRNRELGAYENEWQPTPFYTKDPFRTPVGPELGRTPAEAQPQAQPPGTGQWRVVRP